MPRKRKHDLPNITLHSDRVEVIDISSDDDNEVIQLSSDNDTPHLRKCARSSSMGMLSSSNPAVPVDKGKNKEGHNIQGLVDFISNMICEWMEEMSHDTDPRGAMIRAVIENAFRCLAESQV